MQAEDLARDQKFVAAVNAGAYASTLAAQYDTSETLAKVAARLVKFAQETSAQPATAAPTLNTAKITVGTDGGEFEGYTTTEPVTDFGPLFALFNLDPEAWLVDDDTVRMSMWQQSRRTDAGERDVVNLYSYRAKFRKRGNTETTADFIERVKSFTYTPIAHEPTTQSLVIVPTDIQLGKVDWNGGTTDTLAQVLASFHKAADIARVQKPAEIVIVDAGDIIENIYSTSSQLATNDIDLPDQVAKAMEVMLEGIKILAPLAPSIRYAAVSSNHGAHRLGPKSPAGDVHADYGIAIARILQTSLRLNPEAFGHVTIQIPDPYMESLAFTTSGSTIGVVHGHQAGSADKLGDWWKGQTHGAMPTADARILIAGHFHSLRVQQSGDARWIMVGSASDRGSSWFTNLKGEQSQSGMMAFLTNDNTWRDIRIL